MTKTTKQCQACKKTKSFVDFHKLAKNKDGLDSYCKICKNQANKRSDAKRIGPNRLAFLNQRKNWHLKRSYGIDLDEYMEILKLQKGVCAICYQEDNNRMLAVDHCHDTGKVRGLLCSHCNRAIGQLRHDTERLLNAVKYLSG